MIILLTGATHVGKTLLAQRLLERYGFPYLSVDHLKMGLIRSGHTSLTPEDDEELTAYLWPIVREIVKTAIENRQNLTVEGCYVPPDWRRDFDGEYLPYIRFACLTMTDAYIDAHYGDIVRHASAIEQRLEDAWTAEELKALNRAYDEDFTRSGESVTRIDTDYETTVARLLETLAP